MPQHSVPGESWSRTGAEAGFQAHMRDNHQPETAKPTNTRDNQIVKGKYRNVTNRNQGNMAPSKLNSPTTTCPEYPYTTEKARFGFKITAHDADRWLQEGVK